MTEADCAACSDPDRMLASLSIGGRVSERKLRLFGCAYCRRLWHLLGDQRSRRGVDLAEKFADGRATPEELNRALGWAWRAYNAVAEIRVGSPRARWGDAHRSRIDAAAAVGWLTQEVDPRVPESRGLRRVELVSSVVAESGGYARRAVGGQEGAASVEEQNAQAVLVRDLLGPLPFRQVRLDPAWLSWQGGTVARLAQAAYDERHLPSGTLEIARLMVLADALEEAGCDGAEILGHLRGPGRHFRGCWALDTLLGKS